MKKFSDLDDERKKWVLHTSHFGISSVVYKLGKVWVIDMGRHSPPEVYKTKREACDMAARVISAFYWD